jgi:hypothetical protein
LNLKSLLYKINNKKDKKKDVVENPKDSDEPGDK